MIKFVCKEEPLYTQVESIPYGTDIVFTLDSDSTTDDIMIALKDFLIAAGYQEESIARSFAQIAQDMKGE